MPRVKVGANKNAPPAPPNGGGLLDGLGGSTTNLTIGGTQNDLLSGLGGQSVNLDGLGGSLVPNINVTEADVMAQVAKEAQSGALRGIEVGVVEKVLQGQADIAAAVAGLQKNLGGVVDAIGVLTKTVQADAATGKQIETMLGNIVTFLQQQQAATPPKTVPAVGGNVVPAAQPQPATPAMDATLQAVLQEAWGLLGTLAQQKVTAGQPPLFNALAVAQKLQASVPGASVKDVLVGMQALGYPIQGENIVYPTK